MGFSHLGLARRVPHLGASGGASMSFLLDVVFADYADDPNPVASPVVGRTGELVLTDAGGYLSITSGVLIASATPPLGDSVGEFTSLHTPVGGEVVYAKLNGAAQTRYIIAYKDTSGSDYRYHLALLRSVAWYCYQGTPSPSTILPTLATPVETALVSRTAGYFVFFRDSGGDWYLDWVIPSQLTDMADPFQAMFYPSTTGMEIARVAHLPSGGYSIFSDDYGYAKINASPGVSGSEYSALADAHIRQTITAPSSLAGEAGIKFRKQDTNNYWYAYFDSAGAFKLDKYVSGAPDGSSPYINVAAAISAGQTLTIHVATLGTDIYCYLVDVGGTKQGGTITDSSYTAQSACEPYAAAAWVSGGGSLGRLEAYAVNVSEEATGQALAALTALSA